MPMTFPAHQGLILAVVSRWPNCFDALTLSVGAAMPDITDTLLGFPINGYFKQWYGHALIGSFTLDLVIGLWLTWLIAMFARHLFRDGNVPLRLRAFLHNRHPTATQREQMEEIEFLSVCGVSPSSLAFFPTLGLI